MKDVKPVLAGLYVAVVFGFSFLFTKEVLEILTPFHLLGFRFAAAALALTGLRILGIINLNFRGKRIGILLLLAFFQPVAYFIFETIGIKLTTASEAGVTIRNEPFYWFHLLGGLLIIIGVWGTNYYENYSSKEGVDDESS